LFTIVAISFGLFSLIVFQALKVGLHKEMVSSTLGLDAGTVQIHAAGFAANMALIQPITEKEKVRAALAGIGLTDFSERIKSPALAWISTEQKRVTRKTPHNKPGGQVERSLASLC
jgi:ABC-type lipoprotein release transport system permease subunit